MKAKNLWLCCAICAILLMTNSEGVQAAAITFNWSAAGATFNQPADNDAFDLTVQIQPNAGVLTLAEGEEVTMQFADFTWSVDTSAQGSLSVVADRLLTVDGVEQSIDQDFNFSSGPFSSLFGGHIKSGTFAQSALLTYDFGARGTVDVLLLQVKSPPGLGTTGTSAFGSMSQDTGLVARFSAYNIIPEPATLVMLSLGAMAILRRRGR